MGKRRLTLRTQRRYVLNDSTDCQAERRLPGDASSRSRFRMHLIAAVLSVLGLHLAVLMYSAYVHSPTLDEPAHLAAGISHWRLARFELYRVNPPLVRMIASVPTIWLPVKCDWSRLHVGRRLRPEFGIGEDLVHTNGWRTVQLLHAARWTCIPFSVLGGLTCFLWATEMWQSALAGMVSLLLWCSDPMILGHGCLITPDCAAAAFGVLAGYMFWRWLRHPTWIRTVVFGLAFGLCCSVKTTWIVGFALWPSIGMFVRRDRHTRGRAPAPIRNSIAQMATACVVAVAVINLVFAFDGAGTRLGRFEFASRMLTGNAGHGESANRFRTSLIGQIPVPLPKEYVLGLDAQYVDFEGVNYPSYLRGKWKHGGWWYYYLYATLVKCPLGTQLLAGATLAIACMSTCIARRGCGSRQLSERHSDSKSLFREHRDGLSRARSKNWIRSASTIGSNGARPVSTLDVAAVLLPPVVILALASSQTAFNHHFRYVLPAFGYVFVLLGGLAVRWMSGEVLRFAAAACLLANITSAAWAFPHHLAYFNEAVGGGRRGSEHLLGSNLDWGQDLLYVRSWLESHPNSRPLYLAYHGYFDSTDIGLECEKAMFGPYSTRGPTMDQPLPPGWYAISANYVYGGNWRLEPHGTYAPFAELQPSETLGYSIFLYKVTLRDSAYLWSQWPHESEETCTCCGQFPNLRE